MVYHRVWADGSDCCADLLSQLKGFIAKFNITLLELGGSHAHSFRDLVDVLGYYDVDYK
ncbi:hypothetical protein YERSI8AC_910002 [Enterobacterales bacterium 8AC]|nr:hypothetical protein YERSI8AC_910002 [Enterobacterales bacterium 8AC]